MKKPMDTTGAFASLQGAAGKPFCLSESGKSALFVVDMNNGFAVHGALASPLVRAIVPAVTRTARLFADAGRPVIAFTDAHSPHAPEFGDLPAHCVAGTDESELVKELLPLRERMRVIGKNSTNGFMVPEAQRLISELTRQGVTNWVVVGCCTDICVKTFAITLKTYFNQNDLPMRVIVPVDAVETYDAPGHPVDVMNLFALYDLRQSGVELVSEVAG